MKIVHGYLYIIWAGAMPFWLAKHVRDNIGVGVYLVERTSALAFNFISINIYNGQRSLFCFQLWLVSE